MSSKTIFLFCAKLKIVGSDGEGLGGGGAEETSDERRLCEMFGACDHRAAEELFICKIVTVFIYSLHHDEEHETMFISNE